MITFENYDRKIEKINKALAAYGIASLEDAERFLSLGADRLGTSRVVRAVQELEAQKTAKEKSKT